VHPVAFNLGSLTIHWYGILLGFGFVAGLWTAGRRGMRDRLNPEIFYDLGTVIVLGAIVGARFVYVISYWDKDFAGKPFWDVFKVWEGGLVFYGGFIGAALAGAAVCKLRKLPIWKIADGFAPSVALGSAIGRIGCLMTGCCFGRACSLPWAIRFPVDSPAWNTQVANGLISVNDATLPVHPTEIYDSLLNFGLYLLLAWFHRRKKFDGEVFAAYLMCYAVTRSITEAFRGDYPPENMHFGLTPAHLVGIGIFAAGAVLFGVRSSRRVKPA
jgi:phosphatidylglycerol---prolipoprotein diacylglyceryl transferase